MSIRMYAEYFGLRELPFNNTPDPRYFFSTPDHEEALASLVYAVQERKGFVLLTGEIGAGKTLVSRMMLRHFGTTITFANINHAVQSARDLMESICSEFELHVDANASQTQLVRLLHDFLLAQFARNLPVVLILDEAQNLPVDAFEQLRMIGNLEADDAKLLQIAIVGQPELQHLVASPGLRQLRQRIFRSFHLPAMNRRAVEGYIQHRLAVAGAVELHIFTTAAVDRIFESSKGLPRLVNAICDNAMLSAYSSNCKEIDRPQVDTVVQQMMFVAGTDPSDSAPPARSGLDATQAQAAGYAGRVETAIGAATSAAQLLAPVTPTNSAHVAQMRRPAYTGVLGSLPSAVASAPRATASSPTNADPAYTGVVSTGSRPLDRRVKSISYLIANAGAVQARLLPLVRRAETAAERAERSSRDLQRREDRLRETSNHIRRIVGELNDMLHRADRTLAEGRREQRAAETMSDRLAGQAKRARRIANAASFAVKTDRIGGQVDSQESVAKSDAKVTRQEKTANGVRSETNAAVSDTRVAGPERMKQMLQNTRDSLSELRNLVHGGSARSKSGERADGTIVTKEKSATLGRVKASRTAKNSEISDSVIATEHAETL